MDFSTWYTDAVDIYRVTASQTGAMTSHTREKIAEAVPCRIYQTAARALNMRQTAATLRQERKLAVSNDTDIRAGDELHIHRGARVGAQEETIRAFAGEPTVYHEPVGAVKTGLAHTEVVLLEEEIVK